MHMHVSWRLASRGLSFAVLFFLAAPVLLGAPEGKVLSLSEYLVRLGYEPVPLERNDDNGLLVRSEINNRKRTFVVDTGCSATFLHKSLARQYKTVGQLGVKVYDNFLGLISDTNVVVLERLKLGRAEFLNQPAWAEDLNRLPKRQAGILGADFLARNFCLIDCVAPMLYVRAKPLSKEVRTAMEGSLRNGGFTDVKLDRDNSVCLAVSVGIPGHQARMLIDTGAFWSILDNDAATRMGLRPRPNGWTISGVTREIGRKPLSSVEIPSLEIGDIKLGKVLFGVAELKGWGIGKGGVDTSTNIDGLLGPDVLVGSSGLIDTQGLRLWLKPPKEHP